MKEKIEQAYKDGIISKKEYDKKIKAIESPSEGFEWQKFKKVFAILSPVEWIKTLKEIGILDPRKWIVYALIFGSLYGYGYLKGVGNKPVHFDMRGKEAHIALNEHFLHILPDGTAQVEDLDGRILKKISVKDIPELRKALKPIGFDVHPFFTAGGGIGTKMKDGNSKSNAGLEVGIGASLFKFYKVHLNAWLTNRGVYLGPDYQLTENFSLIGGMGKGWEGGTRGYIGGKWKF